MIQHVNVKTEYNFLRSLIKIDEYINFAKQNNLSSLFICDEVFMYATCEFYKKCKQNNIKPIIGISAKQKDSSLLLYAKTKKGFDNILKISFYFQQLEKYENTDLISNLKNIEIYLDDILIIPNIYTQDLYNEFIKLDLIKNKSILYGIDNNNLKLISIIKDDYIWTEEVNYINKEDLDFMKGLIAISKNVNYNSISLNYNSHYLADNEINNNFDIKIHNENIIKYFSDIDFDLYTKESNFVEIKGVDTNEYLRKISLEKIDLLFKNNEIKNKKHYIDRLNYELKIINDLNFNNYFYVVSDFIKYADENDILIGPGRGSAAGSLVSFLTGITRVDPIKYDLIFERFLNKDRVTQPDIDIDVEDVKREELLKYLSDKYGKENFALIVTYQNIKLKQAFRDCQRIFPDVSSIIDNILKKSNSNSLTELEQELKGDIEWNKFKSENNFILEFISKIIDLPRQSGTHASGVVFSKSKLINIIPIRNTHEGWLQTQISMNDIENFGLIKIDILGLKNLSILHTIMKQLNLSKNDLDKINLKDKKTFEIFSSKNTNGIFQFESEGIKNTLQKIKPNSISEIADASALFRPGPQKYIPIYVENKNNLKGEIYINESIKNILYSTHGVIVYQEQLMKMLQIVAGFSLNDSDTIRRGISKKAIDLIDKYKNQFFIGAKNNGYSDKDTENIWNSILEFADYGFNKSHAISYALISYWLAYFKSNNTGVFYSSYLNFLSSNDSKFKDIIYEINYSKIKFAKINICKPVSNYIYKEHEIHTPLNAIKNINNSFCEKVCNINLDSKNIVETIKKLVANNMDEKIFKAIISVGGFDSFNISRSQLLEDADKILKLIKMNIDFDIKPHEDQKDNNSLLSQLEIEYLGHSISYNLFNDFRRKNKEYSTINEILELNIKGKIICQIESVKEFKTKSGDIMAFVDIFDGITKSTLNVFPRQFQINKKILVEKKYIVFEAVKSDYKEEKKLVLKNDTIRELIIVKEK